MPELDLDLPTGDADLLDEQAEQGLFLLEVEAVVAGADAFSEVVDAYPHLVVAGQFLALAGQGSAALGETSATVLDFGVAPLELGQVDQSGLVEVEEPAVLGVGGVLSSGKPRELCLEQFVVGCRCQGGDGALAGEQQGRSGREGCAGIRKACARRAPRPRGSGTACRGDSVRRSLPARTRR
jgi:hypothetical protein